MAKKQKQSPIERQKNKKGDGTITKMQLLSCYAASAIIAVLCIWEGLKPETQASGNPMMYYALAVVGVAYSVLITVRNNNAKQKSQPKGKRLK